ncbi:MAG: VOC family protein [Propionibacteriaceae bacterium]
MHVDHLTYAVAANEGLAATVGRLERLLGGRFRDGGVHPSFGTRNNILPLADDRYLEVVEVLDHPAADKAVYGQAVRARSEMGGGWMSWVISVPDLSPFEQRLGREAVKGTRVFPDGRRLDWEQIGLRGVLADPQLPYFLTWKSEADVLPRALPGAISIASLEIAGNRKRLEDWLGAPVEEGKNDGVELIFTAENGHPGLGAVTFIREDGTSVRI